MSHDVRLTVQTQFQDESRSSKFLHYSKQKKKLKNEALFVGLF